jgi:hypothetical protein
MDGNDRVTTEAALNVPLPGWDASTVQVPTARPVTVLPETAQTEPASERNATVKPELDDADKVIVPFTVPALAR